MWLVVVPTILTDALTPYRKATRALTCVIRADPLAARTKLQADDLVLLFRQLHSAERRSWYRVEEAPLERAFDKYDGLRSLGGPVHKPTTCSLMLCKVFRRRRIMPTIWHTCSSIVGGPGTTIRRLHPSP